MEDFNKGAKQRERVILPFDTANAIVMGEDVEGWEEMEYKDTDTDLRKGYTDAMHYVQRLSDAKVFEMLVRRTDYGNWFGKRGSHGYTDADEVLLTEVFHETKTTITNHYY